MGWAHCGPDEDGREMGYGVEAICDEPGCSEEIDRGLGHLCGDMHRDGQSCNKYYCGTHLGYKRCHRCADATEE